MFRLIGFVVSVLSLVLDIIGLVIPYWLYESRDTNELVFYQGLWQQCITEDGVSHCSAFEDAQASLKAVRAMEVMGMLTLIVAVGCFAMKLFVMKQQNMLPKVGAALAIFGGTFAIIGCVIFVAKFSKKYSSSGFTLHAGFVSCTVAAVGAYVSAAFSFLNRQE